MSRVQVAPATDLGMVWDEDAARNARVLVSPGRIEIVLHKTDHKWVEDSLDTLATDDPPTIVIACPE